MDKNVMPPIVTVLMPVYNAEKYLKDAIYSILTQTFKSFELLIINDGSSDRSANIIKQFNDSRIVYVENESNLGIVKTLNKGIELSRGKYIARMDADDISLPTRLELQLDFLSNHPEYKLCGGQAIAIDGNGNELFLINVPVDYQELKVQMLFNNSFVHPATCFDACVAREILYSLEHQYAEDYYFFTQIISKYKAANLKESILKYRIHPENLTSTKKVEMDISVGKILKEQLDFLFKDNVSERTLDVFLKLVTPNLGAYPVIFFYEQLVRLKAANRISKKYNTALFEQRLFEKWYEILLFHKPKNALFLYFDKQLFSKSYMSFKHLRRMFKAGLKGWIN